MALTARNGSRLSFRDLDEQAAPTPADVLLTLMDYVRTRAAIIGEVVVDVAERAQLCDTQLHVLGILARRGVEAHSQQREQDQYQLVADHVARKLSPEAAV